MNENRSWTVKCQDAGDGTGDLIVDLPPELLAEKGWKTGDKFSIECIDGAIVLKPILSTPDVL